MEPELQAFMTRWGGIFVNELKAQLQLSYKYAPGINGDAYSRGRNEQYSGQEKKVNTGALLNSISASITPDGLELLMLDYWEFVNYGRKAGKYVPIRPLEVWASQKGFPNPKSAAFGISRNIFKFGIAPTNFYDNAINVLEGKFSQELEDAAAASFELFFNNLLENTISTQPQ
jgi:hypothetical protein